MSKYILDEVIMEKFEIIIQHKDILMKATPFTVNHTSSVLLSIIQVYFTPQDKKLDDIFIINNDDETEP